MTNAPFTNRPTRQPCRLCTHLIASRVAKYSEGERSAAMKDDPEEEEHKVATLSSYWRFLQQNRPFRLVFLGEVCFVRH